MSTEFYPLTVSSITRLTKDAVELTFQVPVELNDAFHFIQGQHLTLRSMIDGKDVRRSYSICSGVQDNLLKVGIKRIEQGVFSTYANTKLRVGDVIDVMPPQGHFYTELDSSQAKNYCFIAAGSGITPNLSHIKTILNSEPQSKVTLIYGNRSTSLMMFREAISFIKNQYVDRFHWINVFSREEHEAVILNGRISSKKLQELQAARLIDVTTFDDVFICGPEEMINDLSSSLAANGLRKDQIHYELFFSGSAEEKAQLNKAQRSEKYGDKTSKVSVKVSGRKTFFELAAGSINILDAAMDNGADLPFACKGGVCATCKAKVVKGQVEMDLNHSLTEKEVADGMILTCQAHPVTDDVEIDFDY